jgi:hypothetical protein
MGPIGGNPKSQIPFPEVQVKEKCFIKYMVKV